MAFQYWRQVGEERRTRFVCLRDAYHGDTIGSVSAGGIDLFHSLYRPLLFPTLKAEPGRPRVDGAAARRAPRRGGGRDDGAARAGRRRNARAPGGLPARRARAVRPPRHAADPRRGGHRLRPHRPDVRLRARGSGAGPACAWPRGSPAGTCRWPRRSRASAIYEGFLGRVRGAPHLLPRPHLHGQPARLRGGAGLPRRVRGGAHDRAARAQDRAAGEPAGAAGRPPGGGRGAPLRVHDRDRAARAAARAADGPPRHAGGAPARRDRPAAGRRGRADAAARRSPRPSSRSLVDITAEAIEAATAATLAPAAQPA